jgi:hypothetical protein
MSRTVKLILLVALLLLDVCVVTPWLTAGGAPGVDRAWFTALIPLITAAVGAMTKKKKQPASYASNPDSGGETDGGGGGFDWGAAAPWLAAGGAGALGYMLGNRGGDDKKKSSSGVLDSMLAQQQARMQQNEPAQQAILSMASGMMPTYMKQPGGGLDQWQTGYEQRAANAGGFAQPRTPVPGSYQLPGAQYEN